MDNIAALKLYKNNDFKIIGVRKKYYSNKTVDAYLMQRKLWFMKDVYILAIESSCDEMSASVVKNGNEEVKTIVLSQMDIHKKYGGVVPEIASRCHIESATMVLDELFNNIDITMDDITAIAVTYGPGLVGSLLVGLQIAKTLSYVYNNLIYNIISLNSK